MNFSELTFWIFLGTGLALVLLVRVYVKWMHPDRLPSFDKLALALLSLSLLLTVNLATLVIFLFVVFLTYWVVRAALAHGWNRKLVLCFLLPVQFAPLVYYKYSSFLINDIFRQDFDVLRHLVIPAGLSFYTFQKASFAVDTLVYSQRMPAFLDFLNFVSFFPMIVAGPIERKKDLLPQMERFGFSLDSAAISDGIRWIVLGLFFKLCLSNNLASFFDTHSANNVFAIWIASIIFGLRIYYDFCGYSLVALGLAKCFGLTLTLNFISPYLSTNIQEFWRRWHVTLSTWFRDYIYFPMGGSRTGNWALNILVVFCISGIWHGASFTFLIWGLLHGLYMVCAILMKRKWPPLLSAALTYVAITFAWVFFYENHIDVAFHKSAVMVNPANYTVNALRAAVNSHEQGQLIAMACFILLAGVVTVLEYQSMRVKKIPYYYLKTSSTCIILMILTIVLSPVGQNEFIYFAF
jgi:alginate O-acetyltransferase complex protein AlgI